MLCCCLRYQDSGERISTFKGWRSSDIEHREDGGHAMKQGSPAAFSRTRNAVTSHQGILFAKCESQYLSGQKIQRQTRPAAIVPNPLQAN